MKHAHPFLLIGSFLLLLLSSCEHSDTVFQSTIDIAGGVWQRFEPRQIEADIPNADDCYELHISALIDTTAYCQPSLPLTIQITSPHGETRTLFASLPLHSRDGHSLGQPNGEGGVLLFNQRVREYFYFNHPGTHTVSIGQRTSRYEIRGIRQLQFTVRKAKLEYPK